MLNHEQWYKKCDEIRDRIKEQKSFLESEKQKDRRKLLQGKLSAYKDCLDILMSK